MNFGFYMFLIVCCFIPFFIALAFESSMPIIIVSIVLSLLLYGIFYFLFLRQSNKKTDSNYFDKKIDNNHIINNNVVNKVVDKNEIITRDAELKENFLNDTIKQTGGYIYDIKPQNSNVCNNKVNSKPKNNISALPKYDINLPILESLNSLFNEIIDIYNIAKNNAQLIKYIKGSLNRYDLYFNTYFNFLIAVPNNIITNILRVKHVNGGLIRNENLIIKYLLRICEAISSYPLFHSINYNNLLYTFNKDSIYLNNFEDEEKSEFDKFLSALIKSGIISDIFTHKIVVLYLMFEERNKILANEFKEKYIKRCNLEEGLSLYYYAEEIAKKDSIIFVDMLIKYYDGYLNDRINDNIFLEEVDIIENEDFLMEIAEKQEMNNFLKELEVEVSDKKEITGVDLDIMSPAEFEEFITKLFSELGYSAKRTKSSGDQGADVIAEKDGEKIAIQVKHYSKPVGNKAVQEVVSSMKYYNAQKSMVITTNYFTKSAQELAKANRVTLWDRDVLLQQIKNINLNEE